MQALIDGDIIVYRVGFALEEPVSWALSGETEHGEFTVGFESAEGMRTFKKGLEGVTNMEEHIEYEVEPMKVVNATIRSMLDGCIDGSTAATGLVYLTGKDNYRVDVAKQRPYKGNRAKARKPELYDTIRNTLIKQHGAIVVNGQEADDAMGIAQCKAAPDTTVICTIDKDLDMIPGWHYNFVKDCMYEVSPENAMQFFYKQLITGDSTDNIPGVPRYGDKKASALRKECATHEDMLKQISLLYRTAYGADKAEEVMNEMAQLLWIRREPDQLITVPYYE